ncbi:hypothetical protein FGB62_22g60 [Gracilaria domingensis]|nr:hypothetical protein FGB62_22g60 [Gracilaria domingensis]
MLRGRAMRAGTCVGGFAPVCVEGMDGAASPCVHDLLATASRAPAFCTALQLRSSTRLPAAAPPRKRSPAQSVERARRSLAPSRQRCGAARGRVTRRTVYDLLSATSRRAFTPRIQRDASRAHLRAPLDAAETARTMSTCQVARVPNAALLFVWRVTRDASLEARRSLKAAPRGCETPSTGAAPFRRLSPLHVLALRRRAFRARPFCLRLVPDMSERPPSERSLPERPPPERPPSERPTSERPTSERPTSERPTSERPTPERPPSASNARSSSTTVVTPSALIAVVCGAHTELGKFVLRDLLRCDRVARVHALAELDPRSELRLTSAQAAKLLLHVDSLEFLERTVSTHVSQCHLAFCALGVKRKPPEMDAYKFHNYNVAIPKRFVQEMFRVGVDRISILCTSKASSRMSTSALQRNTASAADYARHLQIERRESLSQFKVPGVSVFKVPLLLTDLKDHFGVKGTATSPMEQIREKIVFKLGIGASNAVHVRDVAKAMVADALEKLDLQNEQPDLALIFKSYQTAFDELRPNDIIITANEARAAQRSRYVEMRASRRRSSNVSGYARYQSGEQVTVDKFSPSDLSQSAVPSALPSNTPSASPSAVPSVPSPTPFPAQTPLSPNRFPRIEMEGYTAPAPRSSEHHSPMPSAHPMPLYSSRVRAEHLFPPSQSAAPSNHAFTNGKYSTPPNQNIFQSPPNIAQGTKDSVISPRPGTTTRYSSHQVVRESSPKESFPLPAVSSSVDALGRQLSRRVTIVHNNEQMPGASSSPNRLPRRESAKEIRSQNSQTTDKLPRRKSIPVLSGKGKSPQASNSKSRSSLSPAQHPFESDDVKSPISKSSAAHSPRRRSSRSSQRYASGRSAPTTSFHSASYGEGGRRRSEVDSLRRTKTTHRRSRGSLPTSASTIISQLSLIASRILEATDRPSIKRYRQAYDPNYLPRGDPRRERAKGRRVTNATSI